MKKTVFVKISRTLLRNSISGLTKKSEMDKLDCVVGLYSATTLALFILAFLTASHLVRFKNYSYLILSYIPLTFGFIGVLIRVYGIRLGNRNLSSFVIGAIALIFSLAAILVYYVLV